MLSRGNLQGEYSKQRWGGEVKEYTWGLGRDAVINKREFWKRVFRERMKVKNLSALSVWRGWSLSPNLTSFAYLTAVNCRLNPCNPWDSVFEWARIICPLHNQYFFIISDCCSVGACLAQTLWSPDYTGYVLSCFLTVLLGSDSLFPWFQGQSRDCLKKL